MVSISKIEVYKEKQRKRSVRVAGGRKKEAGLESVTDSYNRYKVFAKDCQMSDGRVVSHKIGH